MSNDEILKELNVIYVTGSACGWWDDKMTEALSEAVEVIKTSELIRANVNILNRLIRGNNHG